MSRARSNLIGLACFALAILTLAVHWWIDRPRPEVFRGTVSRPAEVTPVEFADKLAFSIQAMREAGIDPARYYFELPPNWRPPKGWQPPENFNPPSWWPN